MNSFLSSIPPCLISALIIVAAVHGGDIAAGKPVFPVKQQNSQSPGIDSSLSGITITPKGSYESVKKQIVSRKNYVAHSFKHSTADLDTKYNLAKTTLEQSIVNELIPFWYGTRWDFNGYTSIPHSGTIACGYFVSTVLQHCGFSLNRYTLAQQAPVYEALTLQLDDSIMEFHGSAPDFIEHFRQNKPEGLYFIGLDFHVGFLFYTSGKLIFIHSAYYDPLGVTAEAASESPGLAASANFYVAEISTNRKLIDCWLNTTKIVTRSE